MYEYVLLNQSNTYIVCWEAQKRYKYEKQRGKQIKSERCAASIPLFMGTGQLPDTGMRERQEDREKRHELKGAREKGSNKKRREKRVLTLSDELSL